MISSVMYISPGEEKIMKVWNRLAKGDKIKEQNIF